MVPFVRLVRSAGWVVLCSGLGGAIVAAFFVSAFFGSFSPVSFSDPGTVILLVPLLASFVLGLLLIDYDLVVAAYGALITTGFAIAFILGFMFAPLASGVAVEGPLFQQYISQRVALSVVLLFPLILLGCIVGRAVGERILPPDEVRKRRAELIAETREWHEKLASIETKPSSPGDARKP